MEINRHLNLVKKKERLLWTDECGRIWIPDNAIMLQTATVCGSACGASRLLWNRYDIIQIVKIHDMENDVDWCEKSRKQMPTLSDGKWPKMSATVWRNTSRGETKWSCTFWFLSMPKELNGYTYVLVLKDGMSGFCELVTTTVANVEVTFRHWWIGSNDMVSFSYGFRIKGRISRMQW